MSAVALLALAWATLLPAAVEAQEPTEGFSGEAELYSRLLGHVAAYGGEAEMQDNASWIGLNVSAGSTIRMFGGVEWQINIFQNDRLFNPGASTDGEFGLTTREVNAFGLRVGFVGIDLGAVGSLALGKQKSVHYDVAGYTADRLNVFGGGVGSIAYPASSDGGETGTGRADQALIYRNTLLDLVEVGVQTQFQNATNDRVVDGAGASARVRILPGLHLGASYTRSFYGDAFRDAVSGLAIDDDGQYFAVGGRYEADRFEVGAVYARQDNGDLVGVPGTTSTDPGEVPLAFDAEGLEVVGKFRFGPFAVLGGYVGYDPDTDDPRVDDDYRVRYGVLGGEWHPTDNAYAYVEFRGDDSRDATGTRGDDVLAIGFYYGFRALFEHGR
jgi:predicted porin